MAASCHVNVPKNPNIHRGAPPPPPIPAAPGPPPSFALPLGAILVRGPTPPHPAPRSARAQGPVPQPWAIPVAILPPPGIFCGGPPPPPAFLPGGFLWGGPAPAPPPAPAITDAGPLHATTFGPIPIAQSTPNALPGGKHPAVTHFFSDSYTILGWLKSDFQPWDRPFAAINMEWIQVDSGWKVDQLIRAMRENADCAGWAVTECIEQGNGVWERGTTFVHESVESGQSLQTVGWTGRRNREDGTGSLHICLWKP
ncbi:hypothetical protein BCR34DRAFT_579352 [Clohesyomyces aquaticus]|uniref:Uncharacterized protein n=1 Tax=Clohesyomyces aquaticus TaxID=1231657 RepID=A0A1Y1YCL8_9PLEO|nr:hypothetical protein BCR34DRAFT_579352 [Clohesyomyces aquaticus]